MRDAVKNKGKGENRRTPTQDPSTDRSLAVRTPRGAAGAAGALGEGIVMAASRRAWLRLGGCQPPLAASRGETGVLVYETGVLVY